MWDHMRDTRHGHKKEEMEGACICDRQTLLERFIDQCVSKGIVETMGERPKKECAQWIECRGRGRARLQTKMII